MGGIEKGSTGDSFQWDGNLVVSGTAAITGNTTITGNLTVGGTLAKKYVISFSSPTGTAQDSGWQIPAGSLLLGVYPLVTTGDSGKTLSVGTSATTPNEYINAVSLTNTGLISMTPTYTNGTNQIPYISAVGTVGSALATVVVGADVAGQPGKNVSLAPVYIATATPVKYKSSAASTAVGSIIVLYI